jgi:lactate dehydrogenase-like 2-hydroxyacid dehydrogenase
VNPEAEVERGSRERRESGESRVGAVVSRPRLAVTRRLPPPVEARLRRDYELAWEPDDENWSRDDWRARTAHADAVLCTPADPVDRGTVEALPASVKIVATFSVGYNHIDLQACAERGIVVTNTPGVLTEATADVALLLLLGAARRAGEGERLMRSGRWTGWRPTQLLGTDLGGKSLGIVGYGRIGQAVAHRARAFGLEVHYLSRRERPEGGPATWHRDEATFWPQCQFLSLHLPASAETRRFLDARRIAQLPRGAVVVNTARGDVVDDDALLEALRSGHVAAAGLDVYAGEPNVHPGYAPLPNTFLLPHLGSATLETRCAMGFRALDNLDAFFAGRVPRDVVPAA